MRLLLIQLLIGWLYQITIVTCVYSSTCVTTCNFPGMICAQGRCKCDRQINLFWTGVRCLPCPSSWAMSDTACIGYYAAAMPRAAAQAKCESMHGSLISLRDNAILSLIYQTTGHIYGRRKRQPVPVDKYAGWTSAQAAQLANLGLYAWNDPTASLFDSTHQWWCKRSTPHLGYQYQRDEPTRFTLNGETEKCVLYRQGHTSTYVVCLADVFCSQSHPFICERSEWTALQFPASTISGSLIHVPTFPGLNSATTRTTRAGSTITHGNGTGGILGLLAGPAPLRANNNSKMIIVVVIVILLLLVAIIAGVFILKKYRRTTGTLFRVGNKNVADQSSKGNARPSAISGVSAQSDTQQENDIHSELSRTAQSKQQKHKKPAAYSAQRFNEFE